MTRIAFTGHRGLPEETTRLVDQAVRAELSKLATDLVGVTCLADGADSLCAQAVLDQGGAIEVFVPARTYRDGLPADHHPTYDALIRRATRVIRLDHALSDSHAHMDASIRMLDSSDCVIAVWDGMPARGWGGTADVVAAARQRGMPVTVVWPPGAQRDNPSPAADQS